MNKDPLQAFIGTKQIIAKPMTRADYNTYRGWELPADENGDDAGYLVEYLDGGASNHPSHTGYISWSPSDVFEKAYQPVSAMTFGHAVEMLKVGHKVARAGWNGKGMFLYFVPAASYPAQRNTLGTMIGVFPDDMVPYCAYIAMKTADNKVVPWLASQTDVLAEDWAIVG
jgi:hypothetical protein